MRSCRFSIDGIHFKAKKIDSIPGQSIIRVIYYNQLALLQITQTEATVIQGEIPPQQLEGVKAMIVRQMPPLPPDSTREVQYIKTCSSSPMQLATK